MTLVWYIAFKKLQDETMVYFYSLSDHPDLVELKALFEKLNPNVAYTGICIYDRFLHIFNELHKIGQLKTFKIIESASGTLYFYSHTKVQDLQVECPKGINLQRIFSEKDVKKAADAYPFKNDHTFHRFQLLAKFNPNFGAFNAQNELLAWCFQHESGMLTALQVLHDHQKRQGLGSTIVKFMIKELAQQNVDTLACVVDENYVSKRLFENIGFQIIDRLHLIEF